MTWLQNVCLGGAITTFALFVGCQEKYVPIPIPPPISGGAGGDMTTATSTSGTGFVTSATSTGGPVGSSGSGGFGIGDFDPNSPPCFPGGTVELAFDQLLLGDTDPNGLPNTVNGWKQYGLNLDGDFSTKSSTNLCKPTAGGSVAAIYPDGDNGIDNSFGKNVLPILLGLTSDLSVVVNQSIAIGELTYLISLADVSKERCQSSSKFFVAGNLGHLPSWDGTDVWPIDPRSLVNPPDPFTPKSFFPQTFQSDGFVGMTPRSQIEILLDITGFRIVLPIQQANIVFRLEPDNFTASWGVIGGIIDKEDLTKQIALVAAAFDPSFCDPNSPTLISILNQLRQASDIMLDGSQDPSQECNGISIGLGFTMRAAQIGNVLPAPPPPVDPCGP